ncbi:MAG TPA: hypothetical protein VFH68_14700 [Polyangia bacterium]|jgi:hypothetical protein|nr:hypothetical protein [Polyangia bacterium]
MALSRPAFAQDRPSENDMFGGPPAAPPTESKPTDDKPTTPAPPAPAAPPASVAPTSPASRDDLLLGNPDAGPQLSSSAAPENPLTIGGQLYLRAQSSALEHNNPDHWSLASPSLLDVYFDARPNERVRAYVRGRMSFDPTVAPATSSASGANGLSMTMMNSSGGALTGGGTSTTGFSTFNASRGPNSVLDQMWIAFDIEHKVFVTAGKQHVRWGTGRFWTPTDYLHPVKRNPLDVFDARAGTTMLKLNFPWEARAWNFYAYALYEDPNTASNTLRQLAGAARAELVQGPAELGLGVLLKRDQRPRAGADLSLGIGDFDLYGEVGLRAGSELRLVERAATPASVDQVEMTCAGQPFSRETSPTYHVFSASGVKPQAVGGASWARKYNDNDVFSIGGEYFYNSVGYRDASLYPGLLFNDACTPLLNFFYTGRHYASLFASLPAPYSWNYTTFTLSTIGNLSDLSFVTRLDYSVTLLTHLTFEAFVAVHYGRLGEFRLSFDVPETVTCVQSFCTTPTPGRHIDASVVDLGMALRLKI